MADARTKCTVFYAVTKADADEDGDLHVDTIGFCPTKRQAIVMGLRLIAAAARLQSDDEMMEYEWHDPDGFSLQIEAEEDVP